MTSRGRWANGRTITATRAMLLQRDGDRCGICGQPLGDQQPDIDHHQPRHHGGSNAPSNLRLAHVSCNRAAGAAITNAATRPVDPTTPPPCDEWAWTR